MAPPTRFLIVLCLGLGLVLVIDAGVSGRVSQLFSVSRPARAGPDCERQMTSEQGDVTVMSNTSALQNCTYVIRPQGSATLYKLWFGDVTLNDGDQIDVRENQGQNPAGVSVGPSNQAPFVLFNTEIHVRVTTEGTTGHHAQMYWAPITVETVTSLECTDDAMKIRVNLTELRWLYNDTDPADISLVNEGCTGRTIGDVWALDNPHSQCYTQRKIDRDFVQYRNALIYKEPGAGPIVREHRWRVDLKCNFRRQMQVGTDYSLREMKNYEIYVRSDYVAEIHVFNDSSLTTEVTSKQIRAQLGDDLYVRIDLKGDWNVAMHLQSCVARPLPTSLTSYTLIQQGCPTDSETFILYTTHNSTIFHFKVFEFYAGSSSVYIDCDVTYCAPLDNGPRCGVACH